mmetsp:Transcript_47020/g.100371  ORF Transcript_47020/g.100371 Transcript_47020/m.100371 type:complete len:227 (-) Transcript_47020:78-758(-)
MANGDLSQLRIGVKDRQAHSLSCRKANVRWLLAGVGVHNARRFHLQVEHLLHLTLRGAIKVDAVAGKEREHFRVRVALHRIEGLDIRQALTPEVDARLYVIEINHKEGVLSTFENALAHLGQDGLGHAQRLHFPRHPRDGIFDTDRIGGRGSNTQLRCSGGNRFGAHTERLQRRLAVVKGAKHRPATHMQGNHSGSALKSNAPVQLPVVLSLWPGCFSSTRSVGLS